MTPDEIGQALHDRATRGATLTADEQESLLHWYADHDRQEMALLNAAPTPGRLADLQSRVEQMTAQVVVQARHIEALTAENARLREEIEQARRPDCTFYVADLFGGEVAVEHFADALEALRTGPPLAPHAKSDATRQPTDDGTDLPPPANDALRAAARRFPRQV